MASLKLALHRSVIFWSGILVMAFICWAWRDSTRHSPYVGGDTWELQSWASGVTVTGGLQRTGGWKAGGNSGIRSPSLVFVPREGGTEITTWKQEWQTLGRMRFARAGFMRADKDGGKNLLGSLRRPEVDAALRENALRTLMDCRLAPPMPLGGWMVFIPYWLLLLAFALPWSALLLWRARRRKRHLRPEP